VQKLEDHLGISGVRVFRSWLAFLLWCCLREGELPVGGDAKSLLETDLAEPGEVETYAMRFVPSLDAWGRKRGQFARARLAGMFQDVGLWLLVNCMFRYLGGIEFGMALGQLPKTIRILRLRDNVPLVVSELTAWLVSFCTFRSSLAAWACLQDNFRG
jgi:hypothetical protein